MYESKNQEKFYIEKEFSILLSLQSLTIGINTMIMVLH